jgi:ABC-type multidrug transport system permease subunit
MDFGALGHVVILVIATSIINSQFLLCFMKLIKDTTTFSTFGNLYGMMSGFLAGTYLPYHMYPETLKKVLIFYPQTHLTSMMRQMYLRDFSKRIEGSQLNNLYKKLLDVFGVNIKWNSTVLVGKEQFCIVLLFFCLFLIILKLTYHK